jgi:HEAT repeat protein
MRLKQNVREWLGALALVSCFLTVQAANTPANDAALDQAFARLRRYDWGQSREALGPLDDAINASSGDSALRRRLARRLAAVLATDAPTAAKVFACERLSRIGSAESIPALAALLPNAELSHMARYALVRIPGQGASRALRRALPAATGKLKVGIINSLGQIEDKDAVGLLTRLLRDPDPDTAAAAASALGCIGTVKAARALGEFRKSAPKGLRSEADSAWLLVAQRLVDRGERKEAASIFRELYQAENPVSLRLAGFRGLITAEPNRSAEIFSQALAGEDDQVRGLAARLLADAPDAPPLAPFIQSFHKYPAAGQVAILDALRWRQAVEGRPTALDALQSNEPAVRLAALRALGGIGTAQDVLLLARKSGDGPTDERKVARSALADLPGRDVTPEILAELQTASPELSVELLRSLATRGAVAANPAIVERLAAPTEAVRTASLEALAVLGGKGEVLPVVRFLNASSDESARDQAEKTLSAMAKREGSAAADELLKGLKDANFESQVVILRVLGIAGGPKALEAVRVLLEQKDSPVRGTAFRVLTEWSSPEAAPDLLRLAQASENTTWGVLAFRGYVRLCREAQIPGAEKKRMLIDAVAIAKNSEQKRLVISALGELHDRAALNVLDSCLADSDLVEETCLAIIEVAVSSDPRNKDEVTPALQQVIKLSSNPDSRKAAQKQLERLGMKPD